MGVEESTYTQTRPNRSSVHRHANPTQSTHPLPPTQLMSLPPVVPNGQARIPPRHTSDPTVATGGESPTIKPRNLDQHMTALTINASISKKTIALKGLPDKLGQFLTFNFFSKYDCTISIYFCVSEKFGSTSMIEFLPVKMAPLKRVFNFFAGNDQIFPLGPCHIDMKACEKCGLTAHGRYYPLIIQIDSVVSANLAAEVTPSSHIIYAEFTLRDGKHTINVLRQKTIVGKSMYEIQETYGIDKGSDQTECVVCMSAARDTMLMPCRHICLCVACAERLRKKAAICPICRTPVHSYVNLQLQTASVGSDAGQK